MPTGSGARAARASFAAVDLGASSGRVIVGTVGVGRFDIAEVHRFDNGPVTRADGLHWDIDHLLAQVIRGLRQAASAAKIRSVGIDSWAVDYGLIGAGGALLGEPFHYRDARTARGMLTVHRRIDPARLYQINGLAQLPINTIYQLGAETEERRRRTRHMLLIPDLIGYRLTGAPVAELTNASTTGLVDASSHTWSGQALRASGMRHDQMPSIVGPGVDVGPFRRRVHDETDLPAGCRLVTVASHDTASAVAAVPAVDRDVAYVSCGTWALVGVELDGAQVTDAARDAGFTNEIGIDGTVRFLRNVTGLWVLQETVRGWRSAGKQVDLDELLAAAAALAPGGPVFDINAPEFLAPGDMTRRIEAACRAQELAPPASPPAVVRCIVDSLAVAIADAVQQAVTLTGRTVATIHLVGGGSRNRLLCQLLADAAHRSVLAGPAEATAIGNLLVQARAAGVVHGDRHRLRELVRQTHPPTTYLPRCSP